MVVPPVVNVNVSVAVVLRVMAMVGSQKVPRPFHAGLQRTTVGSYVPSAVVQGSYLSPYGDAYGELANGAGI